jgi:biopolymer transport protein ExbD
LKKFNLVFFFALFRGTFSLRRCLIEQSFEGDENMLKPNINVTPLIDVLLVLLIIFMVVAPKKATDFKTKIPHEPEQTADVTPHPHTLVVTIDADSNLRLNNTDDAGTIQAPEKLIEKLREIFAERAENRVYDEALATKNDISEGEKILKTVFIKAPRAISYGNVVKVIDAVKTAGANPISLQIDDLN